LYNNINGKSIKDIEDEKIKNFIDEYLKEIPDEVLQEISYDDPARSATWARSPQPDIHFTDEENLKFYQQFRSR